MMGEIEVKRDPESIEERAKLRIVKTCWNCKHAKEGEVTLMECTHPERVGLRARGGQDGPLNLLLYSLFPDPDEICGLWDGSVEVEENLKDWKNMLKGQ